MKRNRIVVDTEALRYVVKSWVETFNDCACCPLYPSICDGEGGIDTSDCSEFIIITMRKGDFDES